MKERPDETPMQHDSMIQVGKAANAERFLMTTKYVEDVFVYNTQTDVDTYRIFLLSLKEHDMSRFLMEAYYKLRVTAGNESELYLMSIDCAKSNQSKGYGSVLMGFLELIAKKNKAGSICGDLLLYQLSHVDRTRLLNYFRKFNFDLLYDERKQEAGFYLGIGLSRNIPQI